MLQNLLKVRYADAPVFLDIASVINAYSLDSRLAVEGQLAPVGRGETFGNTLGTPTANASSISESGSSRTPVATADMPSATDRNNGTTNSVMPLVSLCIL